MDAGSKRPYALGTDVIEETRQQRRGRLMGVDYLPPLRAGMCVLDVGSGIGSAAREVSGRVRPGRVVGLDRSPQLTDRAKGGKKAAAATNLTLQVGDALSLPFRDESFDLAWLGYASRAIAEQTLVTRGGGLVAAIDVDFEATVWYPELPAFRRTRAAYCRYLQDQGADPLIGRKLYALLNDAGLQRVTLQTHGFLAYGPERELLSMLTAHEIGRLESTGANIVDKGLVSQPEVDRAVAELKRVSEDPHAIWWGCLFACTGRKA